MHVTVFFFRYANGHKCVNLKAPYRITRARPETPLRKMPEYFKRQRFYERVVNDCQTIIWCRLASLARGMLNARLREELPWHTFAYCYSQKPCKAKITTWSMHHSQASRQYGTTIIITEQAFDQICQTSAKKLYNVCKLEMCSAVPLNIIQLVLKIQQNVYLRYLPTISAI